MITLNQIAERIDQGIQAQPGEVIQSADRTGRADWLYALFLALERVGPHPSSTWSRQRSAAGW